MSWLPHPNYCGYCGIALGSGIGTLYDVIVHGLGCRTETEKKTLLTTDCPVCVAKAGQICVNTVTGEKLRQDTPCHVSRIEKFIANPLPITPDNHVMTPHEEAPGKDHPLRNRTADSFSSQPDGSLFFSLIRNRPNEWLSMSPVNGGWRPESRKPILWAMCS